MLSSCIGKFWPLNQGPELQYLLKVKENLSLVLIFQHAMLDAK